MRVKGDDHGFTINGSGFFPEPGDHLPVAHVNPVEGADRNYRPGEYRELVYIIMYLHPTK